MQKYSFVKDDFIENEKATISILERGFRFGDGIFETIRLHNTKPYNWDYHIKRLRNGLSELKINFSIGGLKDKCAELIKLNQQNSGFLRISISRGIGSIGYLPDIKGEPLLVIETMDSANIDKTPKNLWLSSYKKIPGQSIPSCAKTMQGLNSTLARIEAVDNNCFDSLLLDYEDNICETSSGNIFWLQNDELFTPSDELDALPGSIRQTIINKSPYKINFGKYKIDAIKQADEVFITNSNWLAMPICHLQPVGLNWKSNKISLEINNIIEKDIKEQCA